MNNAKPTLGKTNDINSYFSDYFNVPQRTIEKYGAFNISLLADLPLFIDPFLLFNSKKPIYRALHDDMIKYLTFLRDKVSSGPLDTGLIDAWFRFPEASKTGLASLLRPTRAGALAGSSPMPFTITSTPSLRTSVEKRSPKEATLRSFAS